jgi:hypothetical protein
MARSKAIGHIIKALNGKRVKGQKGCYEFPSSAAATKAVWEINRDTGRECANRGSVVIMYT